MNWSTWKQWGPKASAPAVKSSTGPPAYRHDEWSRECLRFADLETSCIMPRKRRKGLKKLHCRRCHGAPSLPPGTLKSSQVCLCARVWRLCYCLWLAAAPKEGAGDGGRRGGATARLRPFQVAPVRAPKENKTKKKLNKAHRQQKMQEQKICKQH